MIITRTPFRISFFGGGTDYPDWYLKEGGAVLSTTIDKFCYISSRIRPPFFDNKYLIVWSHIEAVSSIPEILHPAVREGLRYKGINGEVGLEIHHQGDLPARAGMGSSSSFAVGLLKALTAHKGKMIGKQELALQAIDLEQNWLKEKVGSQDQVAAAYGGFNIIHFLKSGEIRAEPVTISKRLKELESKLMLFYTGTSRLSSEIAGEVIDNLASKQAVLHKLRAMVEEALSILNGTGTLDDFGKLLDDGWNLKRTLSDNVSNDRIDRIYAKAKKAGAIGGKLLGAGSSGFMVFYVPTEKQEKVRDVLDGFLYVPFKFENEGSKIIYYTTSYC